MTCCEYCQGTGQATEGDIVVGDCTYCGATGSAFDNFENKEKCD